jgi:hypothetical protein
MKSPLCSLALFLGAGASQLHSQSSDMNYDEFKVPEFDLPDPQILEDSTPVTPLSPPPLRSKGGFKALPPKINF